MKPKKKYCIIVAGGSGKRMGNDLPKQFIEVAGLPILMHTIKCFYSFDSAIKIIVVLPKDQHNYWQKLIEKHSFRIEHSIAQGGQERFHSVKNGLAQIQNNSLIAIHDGVRPLVSKQTIKNCFDKAELYNAIIPVVPATESIRKVDEEKSLAVDRTKYFMVQTPQVFQSEVLTKAYEQNFNTKFTDDASVVESAGHEVKLVEGNVENIKITRPMDLLIADTLLT